MVQTKLEKDRFKESVLALMAERLMNHPVFEDMCMGDLGIAMRILKQGTINQSDTFVQVRYPVLSGHDYRGPEYTLAVGLGERWKDKKVFWYNEAKIAA